MQILKVINNNVVSALDETGNEIVVMGKGIGFQKKPNDIIDELRIEKTFYLPKEHASRFEELVENMPYEHIRIADQAITYASGKLHKELNRNIYITLTDHLNFSIERQKRALPFTMHCFGRLRNFIQLSLGLAVIS